MSVMKTKNHNSPTDSKKKKKPKPKYSNAGKRIGKRYLVKKEVKEVK